MADGAARRLLTSLSSGAAVIGCTTGGQFGGSATIPEGVTSGLAGDAPAEPKLLDIQARVRAETALPRGLALHRRRF